MAAAGLPAGSGLPAPAVTMDLFATALAAAEVQPPRDRVIDGKDLLPLLSGNVRESTTSSSGSRARVWRPSVTPDGSCTCWPRPILAPATTSEPLARPPSSDGVTILAPYEQYPAGRFSRHPSGRPAACDELV